MKKETRWICFGEVGGWAEWVTSGPTKKEALKRARKRLIYYNGGYLRDNMTWKEWIVNVSNRRLKLTPFVSGLCKAEFYR